MELMKWTPTRSLLDFDRFDRLFDSFFENDHELTLTAWQPRVDISEDENNYYANFELPGLQKDDIHVNIENGILTVRGERKMEKKDEGVNYHRVERAYGTFERSFRLTDEIDTRKIDAEFRNGILSVSLPKTIKAKQKKMEIKVK